MTSRELPLVLVSQLPQKKEDKDTAQRDVEFLMWGQLEKEQGEAMDEEMEVSAYETKSGLMAASSSGDL